MCHEDKESHLMEGLLIGGLIGAAVGVLFAPLSGEKSRDLIKDKLKEFDLDDVISRFSQALAEAKKEAGKVQDDLAKGE
ncbi:MAG: YtxH domain-containing protein [Candidatus Margulisbacteria bacterium]|nr:YtxH domain-containing protein [Candidatus Margulisiibacteriota bacterium]